MPEAPTTTIDLSTLGLSHGDGKRFDVPVRLAPFEIGGQVYLPEPPSPTVRLEVSRPAGGFAFHLRFAVAVAGPCMRCLEPAALELEVDSREVDQAGTDDEELRSPYVDADELDLGRWAHDAAMLALPTATLCRPECKGLCPVCGEPLNDADPAEHEHGGGKDPRWAALVYLRYF
jgi:uncharacterized protein